LIPARFIAAFLLALRFWAAVAAIAAAPVPSAFGGNFLVFFLVAMLFAPNFV
jgi:hypothetical protein